MDDDSRTSLEEPEEEELTSDDLVQRGLKKLQDRFLAEERAKAREEGYKVGYELTKREVVLRMSKQGFTINQIACAVGSDEVVVESWLAEME